MSTPPARRREPCQIGPLAIVALAATAVAVVFGARDGGASATSPAKSASGAPQAWRGFVAEHGAQVALGQRQLVVLREPSLADRVARAGGHASDVQERRWTRDAFARQREVISRLALQGVVVEPEFTYARVLNGFSAALDAQAAALLERMPEVQGLYPVRAVYPASTPFEPLPEVGGLEAGALGRATLPGFTGRGVTIALLDTGVDRAHPLVAGRVRGGYDVVDDDRAAIAEARPGDPRDVERHGTELAGVLVARPLSGHGPRGVVPGASVMPVRVAGWQQDAAGDWAVFGRTDQLIAGLERAVDPNGDGDAHDAARIALVGVAEPFAAFSAGPSARAVTGAAELDTLVVVPAGNDGPAGPAFGSVGGPGGAPAALTVGAADLRRTTADVPVVVRAGMRVLLERRLPLIGAVAPRRPLTLRVAATRVERRRREPRTAPPTLADFFGADGTSLVAGRAALVSGRSAPGLAVENAVAAGAYAVLLSGGRAPAGALGLGEGVSVPVVGLPGPVAAAVLASVRRGAEVTIAIGPAQLRAGPAGGAIADFSSRGLAFDGRVKPELVAPGVALATVEPGTDEDGTPHIGTLNGSSAAAAVVAGSAAALAQARPDLDAAALKSLLVGSARRLVGAPMAAQGTGLVDLGAAAAGELSLEPASVAFGSVRPGRTSRQTVVVRNVSTRRLTIRLRPGRASGAATVAFDGSTGGLLLRPGEAVPVTLEARVPRRPGSVVTAGEIVAVPAAGIPQRIPWALTVRPERSQLIVDAKLSTDAFEPSDTAPAVLTLRAGRFLLSAGGVRIEPVARLDVELWSEEDQRIGLLARLRDLLPVRLAFGLTGRGPGGQVLDKGLYRLRLVAAPPGNGPPTRRTLTFRIE